MNATRFDWAKLEGAKNLFLMSKTEETSKTEKTLHKVQNTCCELINEFRCPRFAQIEAHRLRSQCFPDNYWFAKHCLDDALELITECEQGRIPYERERTLAVLAEYRQGVDAMLQERLKSYEEEWKAQGKDVPTEDEWYEIKEGEVGDDDIVFVVEGGPIKGSDFPFEARRGDSSLLVGKTLPPLPRKRKVDAATESMLQEEHDANQEEQEIQAMDLAGKEGLKAAAETAERFRQLEITEGIAGEGDKMDVEGAPPSPVSDKQE